MCVRVLGAASYLDLFSDRRTDFLDVMFAFPSCQPPMDRLIGQLIHTASLLKYSMNVLMTCLSEQ